MRKTTYVSPQTEIVNLNLKEDIAQFVIGVSGETTPEESDAKDMLYFDDNDDIELFTDYGFNVWE